MKHSYIQKVLLSLLNKNVMLSCGPSPIALTGFMYTVYSLLGYSPLIVTLVSVVLIVILCTLTM